MILFCCPFRYLTVLTPGPPGPGCCRQLAHNRLNGTISDSLGDLKSLEML